MITQNIFSEKEVTSASRVKHKYVKPQTEVIEIVPEVGFANSMGLFTNNLGDGGEM